MADLPLTPDSLLPLERIEAALEAAGVGVWEMDLTSRQFTCSARCKQLFGFAQTEPVLFDHLLHVAHAADRQALEQGIARALQPGSNGRFALEYRVLWSSGEERWVRSTGLATFDPTTGQPVRFQGVTKDITDTQAHSQARQQQVQEFEFLAECVPEIIWIARADGGVTYFNRRWMEYTGQTLAQAQEWGWEPVIHPEDLPRCLERWNTSLATAQLYEVEYRFRQQNGEYRWFLGRALPLKDEAGHVLKWFGTCTDIHDHMLVQAALRRREEELEHAYKSLEAKVMFRTLALEQQVREQQQRIQELEQQLPRPSTP
ncbi:PAS domain-containing protein [Hymenobacter metallilatus]|uniref:histidine kinase n=1 Tax=Hymenobacter metallilatus TaxID=2493666 RepID=A0A428JRB0_9BACT|nr:PAS domain-containing protein [Hymenobacter metallilatus]RSK36106.1 PAS domain S-box protein [Hymenobacter metallilatus]